MCPGFDSRTRRLIWIEFVVGSRSCSESFSPSSPVFLPPQKLTFVNSNSIRNSRATGLSVEDCCVSLWLNKVNLFILFIYLFILFIIYLFFYLVIYYFIYLFIYLFIYFTFNTLVRPRF